MIISHQHQFVFVRTKKTASTSMEIALSAITGPTDIVTINVDDGEEIRGPAPSRATKVPTTHWGIREWARWVAKRPDIHFYNHMPASEIKRYMGKAWEDYYTFAVDRNPWDLTVSAYSWRSARHPDEWPDFETFVLGGRLPKYSNWKRYSIGDRIAVDQVIRYEQLSDALSNLTTRLGIPPLELPRAKSRYRIGQRPYQDWYTVRTRDRVADVFSREIDQFGWTFD